MKKIKIKWKNLIVIEFILCFITLLILALLNILLYYKDSKKIEKELLEVEKKVIIENRSDNLNTSIIEEETKPKEDPYWDYIKTNLINVDFSNLKKTNNDVKGWLQVSGTIINYPFVQGSDNLFYLTHSFDKSYNRGGWVYLDYRNNNTNNKHSIIYAHGRSDKTMFGTLKNILSNEWLDNKNNHIVRISTEQENTLWQVFSVYKIPNTSDYLKTTFKNDDDFLSFNNMLIKRSIYNFKTNVNKNDKTLTLSTCFNPKNKVVLHAKLIKIEKK